MPSIISIPKPYYFVLGSVLVLPCPSNNFFRSSTITCVTGIPYLAGPCADLYINDYCIAYLKTNKGAVIPGSTRNRACEPDVANPLNIPAFVGMTDSLAISWV